jgi:hypothetical protein
MTRARVLACDALVRPLFMERIYDPENPNFHGYRLWRSDLSLREYIAGKLLKWWSETLWSLYGRDRIVAVYLHREQSLGGSVENWMARQILAYIFGGSNHRITNTEK